MYELVEYAQGRLMDTVILIDKVPCYVSLVDEDRVLTYHTFLEGREQQCSLDSNSIDLTPLSLGYSNFKTGAVYLVRTPIRRWKQGTDRRSIHVIGVDYRRDDWFTTTAMLKCFNSEYPSCIEALLLADVDRPVVAFCKNWAVSYKGELYFRGTKVGSCKGKITLEEAYHYLQEMLEEEL